MIAKENFLRVTGHAGYEEKGKDIVCAAVSTLTTGAAEIWKNETGVIITKFSDSDYLFNFCWENTSFELKYQYDFLRNHYKLIANSYTAYVSFEE